MSVAVRALDVEAVELLLLLRHRTDRPLPAEQLSELGADVGRSGAVPVLREATVLVLANANPLNLPSVKNRESEASRK